MTDRQRFYETTHFGSPDRPSYLCQGIWPQTIERWEDEGMPPDVHPNQFFGFDRYESVPHGKSAPDDRRR